MPYPSNTTTSLRTARRGMSEVRKISVQLKSVNPTHYFTFSNHLQGVANVEDFCIEYIMNKYIRGRGKGEHLK
jgi:hypothetical protein